jgi:glyoxylase-like metal-dependent hydrolase (beta-lactamase superfamily II)
LSSWLGSEKILAATAGAPIRRILLIHAHMDHVGSVDALAAQLPGVRLAAFERTLPLLRRRRIKAFAQTSLKSLSTVGCPGSPRR